MHEQRQRVVVVDRFYDLVQIQHVYSNELPAFAKVLLKFFAIQTKMNQYRVCTIHRAYLYTLLRELKYGIRQYFLQSFNQHLYG
jgi:hypothetical protein